MVIEFPGEFRPGGPTTPQLADWHLKFLQAEEDATATLMGFFKQARLELEAFIREGDLTVSDAKFYRDLLDETNRIGSRLNTQGATWVTSVIPEAYVAGRRLTSSVVIPERALQALSRDPLALIRDTSDLVRTRIRQVVATGILEGLSGADLRQRILSTGLVNIPRWPTVEYRAGVIARTETMKAFNQGALDGYTDNGAKFVRWIASPDEATCSICAPRDGQVYRLGFPGVDDDTEIYPNALMLEHAPPAHPRCRCTIRAEYRDEKGQVIRDGVSNPQPPEEPKLKADTMGATSEPRLPPAVGDWKKTAAGLHDPALREALSNEKILTPLSQSAYASEKVKLDLAAAKAITDPARSFWRSLPKLTDAQLQEIASIKGAKGFDAMDSFLQLRYGARFEGKSWPVNGKFYAMRALERVRLMDAEYLVDSKFFQFLGSRPYRAKMGSNTIAACWADGHIDVSLAKWKRYLDGQGLRAGPNVNAGEEVILHEFMHAVHNEYGLHTVSLGGGFPGLRNAPGLATHRDFESAWKGISTRGQIAPDASTLDDLRQNLDVYQRYVDDPQRAWLKPHNEKLVEKYQAMIDEAEAAIRSGAEGGPDFYPTEYAKRGGYAEDFAESAMLYHLNPQKLRKYSPGRFAFIRRYIAREKEFEP